MKRTVKEKMEEKVRRAPKGKLFVLSDFSDLGNYKSIQKTVSLMVASGMLMAVYKGIYKKPNFNKLLNREVPSSPSDIAVAYARKNNWKIAPSGDVALNQLGLSTQVPNVYQYVSSGPTRKLELENGRQISFRHVEPRESDMNSVSSLVIEALKALGKDEIDDDVLRKIKSKLTKQQFELLKKNSSRARTWIRDAILRMEELDARVFENS
jgi:hypothetical protein